MTQPPGRSTSPSCTTPAGARPTRSTGPSANCPDSMSSSATTPKEARSAPQCYQPGGRTDSSPGRTSPPGRPGQSFSSRLAPAKLAACRDKDPAFVVALLDANLLTANSLIGRLADLPVSPQTRRPDQQFPTSVVQMSGAACPEACPLPQSQRCGLPLHLHTPTPSVAACQRPAGPAVTAG